MSRQFELDSRGLVYDDEQDSNHKIPWHIKIAFSAPTVATLPFVAMWGVHGNVTYQAFGVPLSLIAFATALARSFDVISDPVMSYVTDSANCRFPSWLRWLQGRRRPFMFFGCFIYALFLWLLLNPPYAGTKERLSAWFAVFYTLFFLANTLTTIPYDALAPELSDDSEERTKLFFVSNLFDGLGTLMAMVLPLSMTAFTGSYWNERNDYICKPVAEVARMCVEGLGCANFKHEGANAAFRLDTGLQQALAPLASGVAAAPPTGEVLRECLAWIANRSGNATFPQLPIATGNQVDLFCDCVVGDEGCIGACELAERRTGFMLVGYLFAIWFVVTMVIAVLMVKETKGAQADMPPIVPSARSTLDNKPFMCLLPAWLCDYCVIGMCQALGPYFVEAIVAPAYQTMYEHGRDCTPSSSGDPAYDSLWVGEASLQDSPNYDSFCRTETVFMCCGGITLLAAIAGLPIWQFLLSRIGKHRTWLLWSLTQACTNVTLLFVGSGQIYLCFFAFAVNGLPMLGKFLTDSILADIIDYGEFLTGTRSEATYCMFKSFLPKIIQIPASAIPLALLVSVGYVEPSGSRAQPQGFSVRLYIKCMMVIGSFISLLAWWFKRRYPLKDLDALQSALILHRNGEPAEDPISGLLHVAPGEVEVGPDETKKEVIWQLDHFSLSDIDKAFPADDEDPGASLKASDAERLGNGAVFLQRTSCCRIGIGAAVLAALAATGTAAAGAVGQGLPAGVEAVLGILPTLCVVFFGIGVSVVGLLFLQRRAAAELLTVVDGEGGEEDAVNTAAAALRERVGERRHLGELGSPRHGSDSEDSEGDGDTL